MGIACRVLIVDDELLVRQGIKHLLNWEHEGFQIVGEASNGKEALEQIERLAPHIVITDIVMPVMGGEELTRTIKTRFPEIEVIILSSFGEFDYVRSTFQSGVADYILKPKLEAFQLLGIVKRTARKIPSLQLMEADEDDGLSVKQVLDKLVSGYETDTNNPVVEEAFPHPSFRLLGVDTKLLMNKGRDRQADSQWLDKITEELAAGLTDSVYYEIPTEQGMVVVLVNVANQDEQKLTNIARKLAAGTSEQLPELGWTLGEAFTDLSQLGVCYKESFLKLNAYRFFLPEAQRLIMHEELPFITEEARSFNMNDFSELMNRRQFDKAFGGLLAYVQASHYQTDVFEFKSFLGNVIFNITILLGRLESDNKILEEAKYAYFKSIGETTHVSQAISQLESFIAKANEVIRARGAAGSNSSMTQLLQYIRDHYAEPLSLTELAKHFHFNPSYLSSYFTSHNKEGFSEYLNKIRVEKAAELLQYHSASISEISGMVGYSDHSYFTKVFKKLTGLSPSHYRKQYMGKKRD
ncbi:two-component system response regulator [Paenibacillus sp. FSL H8-0548]|uniref:response regulator transcription factor n=1 Tax=Paenibacillus sp. FSL H8-0548 TaxID=1920422 RepID=UPI00096D2E1F|nr:response regulator transcription factor [Paenibacillus sp. FSL H8-0548]OMF37116.1 two-component system response regulator [Paenibacillus sp. FSL H8-0548]